MRISSGKRPATWGAPCTMIPRPTRSFVVGETVGEPAAGGVQQQPWRLDRVAGDRDRLGCLEALLAVVEVGDAGAASGLVGLDPRDHAVGAHLDAVLERVGDVGDERGCLGADLAALQAEAAVDAVRAVPEAAVGDPDWADAHLDPQAPGALPRLQRAGADGVRAVRIVVGVAPGPPFAGDGQLALQALVVGLEILVGDRPVGGHAVAACRPRSPRGESAGCTRRSGSSSRRRRGRSCSCRAPRGPRRR